MLEAMRQVTERQPFGKRHAIYMQIIRSLKRAACRILERQIEVCRMEVVDYIQCGVIGVL